jgi:hypothetical protein
MAETGDGHFNTMLSYSGLLDYDIGSQRPRLLYVDVAVTADDMMPFQLNATEPYNGTVGTEVGTISGDIHSIPGVLDIQPSLLYVSGSSVDAASVTVAHTNLSSSISDGHIHLDLVDPDKSYASGLWDGNYASGVAIDPVASIRLGPFIRLTSTIVVNVTGIESAFSQGFTSTATNIYDFQLTGPNHVCTRKSYRYSIEGFNLEGWQRTLFDRQDPFSDGCQ